MPTPERYAVIGHPIGHSLSPRIHAMFAQQTGQAIRYEAIDVRPEQLAATLHAFFARGGRGLNVTVPHKQTVLPLLHALSERARRARAVNTIVDEMAGLLGDNTDGVGLIRDLRANLRVKVEKRRVLLLGAGGAARGVLGPLLALRPAELVIANRGDERAQGLAREFAGDGTVRSQLMTELTGEFGLIVNATAASLQGTLPPLPAGLVGRTTVCYDLAYGLQPSAFVRWARGQGAARAYMGLGMLVEQAAESFWLWRGVRPQTEPVLAALRADGVTP